MTEENMQMLRDIVIGEATLAILNENIRVSLSGILYKLKSFLREEKDENRVHALNLAIRDVVGEIKRRGAGQKISWKAGKRIHRMNTMIRPGINNLSHILCCGQESVI